MLFSNIGFAQDSNQEKMSWEIVKEFPSVNGVSHPGFAGVFAGVSNDKLLIAGGANFPDKMPWNGGLKNWSEQLFVLSKSKGGYSWELPNASLLSPRAYGASVTISEGVVCIGGSDGTVELDEVLLMSWDINKNKVVFENFPSLPKPLAHVSASIIKNTIYVGGGQSDGKSQNFFFKLDLNARNSSNWSWETLPVIPGSSRAFATMVAQYDGFEHGVFVFSGRSYDSTGNVEILDDAYFYSPSQKKWEPLNSDLKFPIMAGNAFKAGLEFVMITSGDDGAEFLKLKALGDSIKELEKVNDTATANNLKKELNNRLDNHKGFSKDVLVYNTITKSIVKISELPYGVVTAPIVNWDGDAYIISGEIRQGVRTPAILKGHVNVPPSSFGWLNTVVSGIYFLLLLYIGYYFSKRQKNADDYFKGGGRVPWWAAGLSIFGTGLSAITFMAIPAKAYATDWAYIWFNFGVLLMAPIIIYSFIPLFRKLNISSAYEYLELRFNVVLRLIGSVSFILFQLGRMAVVLFLPAIAINVVTGIDIYTCILMMGLFSLFYTLMGGIEAVIWTDALQVVVLLGGAILCLVLMIFHIDGGFPAIIDVAMENNKLSAFDLALDWKTPTLWVVLVGGFFTSLATYGSDQTMVQRYLTTSNEKGAIKSLLTNVWLTLPATFLFFFIGTALFTFFKQHPEKMNFSLSNGDSIFPWYIVRELPNGVVGILICGILAAAMSSVSSSINSAATSYSIDIHFRFFKTTNELKLARIATFLIGITGTLIAVFMAGFEIKSLWDVFNKILGLVLGSMSGLFLLGIFFKKASAKGALIGFAGSVIVQIYVASQTNIHLLLYTAFGMVSCIVIGRLASIIFPRIIENKKII
jgi:SSS family transporter